MKKAWIVFVVAFCLLPVAFSVEAATSYYVATTGNDGNVGTSGSPWLTIQHAASANLNPGDTVFIRGGTYSQATINLGRNGSAGNPIIWTAEPGTGQVWIRNSTAVNLYNTGIIHGFSVSYNRFDGLGFGGPSGSLTDEGIKFFGSNNDFIGTPSDARGNEIINCTFSNIGHDGALVLGGSEPIPGAIYLGFTQDTLINSNTFDQIRGTAIKADSSYHETISNNTITNMVPIHYTFGDGRFALAVGVTAAVNTSGTRVNWSPGSTLRSAGYTTINGNTLSGVTLTNTTTIGIWLDSGGHNATITNNNISGFVGVDSSGIFLESGVANVLVVKNLVNNSNRNYDTASPHISSTNYNSWINNTSIGGAIGFAVRNAHNNFYANNISYGASRSAVLVTNQAVGQSNVWRNNLYFRTSSSNFGIWNCNDSTIDSACVDGSSANLALAAWNTASGETASKSADPLFINSISDFHLQAGSPAINAGTASLSTATITYTPTFAGSAPDMGAFESGGGTVTWVNDRGGSGTATGTANWTASVPLKSGINNVTVTATDASGNAASAPIAITYAPPFPGNTLAAAYGFNEGTGINTADASTNGNTGSLVNGVTWAGNQTITLNPLLSQFVSVSGSANNTLNFTQSFTLSASVNPNAVYTDFRSIMEKPGVGGYAFEFFSSSGTTDCGAAPSIWFNTNGISGPQIHLCSLGGPLQVNQFTHLAATYDGTTLKLYRQGVLDNSTAASGYIEPSTNQLYIGSSENDEYFGGQMKQVRLYDYALPLTSTGNVTPGAACTFTDPLVVANQSIVRDMNCPVISPTPPLPVKIPASATALQVGQGATLQIGPQ